MRNLLTNQFKKTLRQEYLLRLVGVGGWVVIIGMVIGTLSLLPSYFLTDTRHDGLTQRYRVVQASIASLTEDTSKAPLAKLKQKLDVLSQDKEENRLTEALLAVLAKRGEAIDITSFAYGKMAGSTNLKIRGVAGSRDALLSFKKALEQDGRFEKVDLPVSNLAKEKDIAFDLTLTGAF